MRNSVVILVITSLSLGVLTTALAHLLGFGITEGGTQFVWGHDFAQSHLEFFHVLWPAVIGTVICVCIRVFLHGSRLSLWAEVCVVLLFVAIVWLLPHLSAMFGMGDDVISAYLLLLAVVASAMWAKLLNARRYGTINRSAGQPLNQSTN